MGNSFGYSRIPVPQVAPDGARSYADLMVFYKPEAPMEPGLQRPVNVSLNPNSHDIANVKHLNGSPVLQFYGSTTHQFYTSPIR